MSSNYRKKDFSSITPQQLKNASNEIKLEVMREWFNDNYDNPVNVAPWDGEEGGYQIPGGGSDAEDVLRDEFEEIVGEDLIVELANELNDTSHEWVPKSISDPD